MAEIINLTDEFYFPPRLEGLEKLVRFPDGEYKKVGFPNSTIWAFRRDSHIYNPHIIGADMGCGMAAFLIPHVDPKTSADEIFKYLFGKNILGRGNHFVDICSGLKTSEREYLTINTLIVHSDGKSYDPCIPKTVEQAKAKTEKAKQFREELGHEMARLIGAVSCYPIGNWTHNSVEEEGEHILYRKGVVKVEPRKVHMLPAHLNAEVFFYTVGENNNLPFSSMPHATGRAGPRGQMKVSPEKAAETREFVYIPAGISNRSLRSEHPRCYNGYDKIFGKLSGELVSIGTARILSYVGKI